MSNNIKDLIVFTMSRNTKQIEVYSNFINILENSKSVVKKFDKKVVNIRFTNALNELLEDRKMYNFFNHKEDNKLELYIDNYSSYICLSIQEKRLNASETIENFDKEIIHLRERIEETETAINDYDLMIAEYTKIQL